MCVREKERRADGLPVCVYVCACVYMCLHAFEEFLVAGRRRSLNLSSGSTGETRELQAAEGAGHK